jgi:predicted site-specific integrase-resolvase
MKLSTWAQEQALTYKTAWRLWRASRLPLPAEQLPTGAVLVHPPVAVPGGGAALYARVSCRDQQTDLERQLGRLVACASQQGWTVMRSTAAIGAGVTGHRPQLLQLLGDPQVRLVAGEHRDRLARCGAGYSAAALVAAGRRLVSVDSTERNDDLIEDMSDVMTSCCARLDGRRAAHHQAKKGASAAMEGAPC